MGNVQFEKYTYQFLRLKTYGMKGFKQKMLLYNI